MSELRWLKRDEYHIRTECGRYTVARRTVNGVDWYVAYRVEQRRDFTHADELDAERVSARPTNDERRAVIKRMQQRCADDAAKVAA